MGTPEFALPSLELLLGSQHQIAGVVTQPDKPRGRGLRLSATPVRQFAERHKLKVLTPVDLESEEFYQELGRLVPDLITVVAYRILPEKIFTLPPLGTINLHASLLPKYRGAAPINWAIIKGEKVTGLTTFFIRKKVDTGKIILQSEVEIYPEETFGELYLRLSRIGAGLLLDTVDLIESGQAETFSQDNSEASLAPKITEKICKIDWSKPATETNNLIRGLSPQPGAFTYFRGRILKIFRAVVEKEESTSEESGKIIQADQKKGILIQTPKGILRLKELQLEGKKRLSAEEFIRGAKIEVGEKLG